MDVLCNNPEWTIIVVYGVIDSLLEYWLGKTDKTKAGSKVEILINILRRFRKKGE